MKDLIESLEAIQAGNYPNTLKAMSFISLMPDVISALKQSTRINNHLQHGPTAEKMIIEMSPVEMKMLAKALGSYVGWPWYNIGEPIKIDDTVTLYGRGDKQVVIKVVPRSIAVMAD